MLNWRNASAPETRSRIWQAAPGFSVAKIRLVFAAEVGARWYSTGMTDPAKRAVAMREA